MQNNRYYFLDGIRGIAAIFVLTRHTSNFWGVELYRSYLAVDVFFILSGFVIANAYDEKLYSGAMSLKKFILVRLIRLYPVFILSLIFCSAILIIKIILNNSAVFIGLPEALKMIGMTALFLPFMMEGSASLFPINGPYWSLFFELISNFIYGIIRPLLNNFILHTVVIIFGLIVAATSYLNGNLDIGFNWGYMSLAAGFSRSIFGIFMGLLLHRHHELLEFFLGDLYLPGLHLLLLLLY